MNKHIRTATLKGRKYQAIKLVSDIPNKSFRESMRDPVVRTMWSGINGALCDITDKDRLEIGMQEMVKHYHLSAAQYNGEKLGIVNIARFLGRPAESIHDFIVVPNDLSARLRQVSDKRKAVMLYASWDEENKRYHHSITKILKGSCTSDNPLDCHLSGVGYLYNYFMDNLHRIGNRGQEGFLDAIQRMRECLREKKEFKLHVSDIKTAMKFEELNM